MAVRTIQTDSPASKKADIDRIYDLLRTMAQDIRDIKEHIERMDQPINSGKDA